MRKNPSLIFFGNERLATGVSTNAPTLQALINAGYNVAAVVSHNEKSNSRNARELEIASVAEKYNIPVLLPNKPSDIIDQLAEFNAEIAVLVAYGKIIPQKIIDIFPKGIINIHPSALPKHRGPTPLESVILSGELTTAVSIMKLTSDMDAGSIYKQEMVDISPNVTKQELADQLLTIGSKLLLEVIPGILNETNQPPKEQDNSKATYDKLIQKQDGIIDWGKSAVQIEREIRAYANWPKSNTTLGTVDLTITSCHTVSINHPECKPGDIENLYENMNILLIECGDGSLCIDRLKPAGKNEMDVEAFMAGYSARLSKSES